MKKAELLAPAGGPEQFKAAVNAGADAIYLGGSMFNARMSADNFTLPELEELADAIKEIEPKDNESVGIQAILSQNFATCNLARYASKFVQEKENLEAIINKLK